MRISDWSSDVCSSDLETPILVRGEPKAQRIRLIPGFFSELCKRTSRALDGDDCPYWFEATQEQPMDLAGYYRYEARWPNGSKTVGTADVDKLHAGDDEGRSEEHTSELQSLMRISYAVFCLKKKNIQEYRNRTKNH